MLLAFFKKSFLSCWKFVLSNGWPSFSAVYLTHLKCVERWWISRGEIDWKAFQCIYHLSLLWVYSEKKKKGTHHVFSLQWLNLRIFSSWFVPHWIIISFLFWLVLTWKLRVVVAKNSGRVLSTCSQSQFPLDCPRKNPTTKKNWFYTSTKKSGLR